MARSELGLEESDWPIASQPVLGDREGLVPWLEYAVYRSVLGVVGALPFGVQKVFTNVAAAVAARVQPGRSRAAREYIGQALGQRATPERVESLLRSAWRHVITVTLRTQHYERVHGTGSPLARYRVEMPDEVRALLAEKRGVFLVTAHVGDWEAGGGALPWLGFKPFYVVSRPPRNRPLSRHFQAVRERHHVRLVPRHGAAAQLPTILQAGGSVLLFLDQRARKKYIVAPFFGRRAKCERGAAVMLRRVGAPLVFFGCWLTDEPFRYELVFTRVIRPEELAGKDPVEVMTIVNRELERLILRRPEQYFWLHDRFRKKKPAEGAPTAPARAPGAPPS
ncbi:MAG: lysophospholipid acyltransferase family protein [Planctomycetes bacterium]|nr:lysophospholipid acyltransferase family protein [Planctomycetota bacterium]